MNTTVKKVVLAEHHSQPEAQTVNQNYLGLVGGIEVQCNIRIGTLTVTIAQLRELKSGQVMHLEQKTNEPVEVLLNDKVIAKGELMSYEDKFAVQITEVMC
ncbi:FliM/FliN family flagellar motor switch protein [Legionella bononiensis]|uniref:Flagellar motor switch protein FliN n=1 Tax=Legionella bononiensis TaxID=2793102 RepID=A0ABS1WD46_9GAMM|nr:FliM/FliN family flagellar motor switch protein [Legionella bononiensis]MBL7479144.1 FliM/FliN family flagellar motor switch protein [Legionella bononiensis]MBL7527277.1 FliM/FliN family flagellar motor switch protein [Legionella bononiensis]MBL7562246.1 FliM/FliN family flagellar motor switch protein [Legionella bononiensis]